MGETYPKEMTAYYFNPKKRVYVGTVLLKDVPGALAGVAAVLGKEGVNIVATEQASVGGTKTSSWGFFAETGDSYDIQKLKAAIEKNGNVLKAEVTEGPGGLVVDKTHYPLRFSSGQQAMSFRRENMVDMFSRIRKIFGSGATLIFYEMGVAAGESDAKALVESVGQDMAAGNLLDLIYLYAALGWGLPELVELSVTPLRATVRFKDSFECANTKSPVPNGHYLRGHLAGMASGIYGKKVKCVETKCMAKGDPYCEIVGEEIT